MSITRGAHPSRCTTGTRAHDLFPKVHLHRHLINHLAEILDDKQGEPEADGSVEPRAARLGLLSPDHAANRSAADGRHQDHEEGVGLRGEHLSVDEIASALTAAFHSTDEQLMVSTTSSAGSTAVAALVTRSHCFVANCGDSRAYVWRDGRALPLSLDHKPDRPDEHARIRAAGGWVSHGRILHILAVSRSLGDREFKLAATSAAGMPITADLVSAAPDVRVCRVQQGDELLLACDGLWDVLSPEAAFDFLHAHGSDEQPQRAVAQLVQAADEQYNSLDNITACFVQLSAPS